MDGKYRSRRIGFDTASSIALLAISAIAKRNAEGKGVHSASVVILPVRRFGGSV